MRTQRLFLGGFVLVSAVLITTLFSVTLNRGGVPSLQNVSGGVPVSPDILFITQPVYMFSGTVEGVSGNIVTVSQSMVLAQNNQPVPVVMPGAATGTVQNVMQTPPAAAPITKTVTFRVTLGPNTQITRPPVPVYYLFATSTPLIVKASAADISIGQYVTVRSSADLRTLRGNGFEAVSVELPQVQNTVSGTIIAVSGNTVALEATPMSAPGVLTPSGAPTAYSQTQQYTVLVSNLTEISKYETGVVTTPTARTSPPRAVKLSLSDLKPNMRVTVYAVEDVTRTVRLTALRIEPLQ